MKRLTTVLLALAAAAVPAPAHAEPVCVSVSVTVPVGQDVGPACVGYGGPVDCVGRDVEITDPDVLYVTVRACVPAP